MSQYTRNQLLHLINHKPEYLQPLKTVVEYEKQHMEQWKENNYNINGWEYKDIPLNGGQINHLHKKDIIDKIYDSNSTSIYRLADLKTTEKTLKQYKKQEKQVIQ